MIRRWRRFLVNLEIGKNTVSYPFLFLPDPVFFPNFETFGVLFAGLQSFAF